MTRILIFAGAPEASALDWSGTLHESFTLPLSSLVSQIPSPSPLTSPSVAPSTFPAWRIVPLKRVLLRTGLTQQTPSSDAAFPPFIYAQLSQSSSVAPEEEGDSEDDEMTQFYEYSLTAHDSLPPPQLTDPEDVGGSFASDYSVAPSLEPGIGPYPTDLADLRPRPGKPDASSPVTLLVGIISLVSKTVKTRFGERELVEALVGDDTRSAFPLTLWLGNPGAVSALSRSASALRVGDVVLVQAVAVGTFRGRVYGQSTRSGMGTRVSLLFRERDYEGESKGHYSWSDIVTRGEVHPQLGKTRRVRRWMRGVDMDFTDGRPDNEDRMPNDTLE